MTLLTESFPPQVGGIENYLSHLAAGLSEDHTVIVMAPSKAGSDTRTRSMEPYVLERRRFFYPFLQPAWLPIFISLWRRARRGEIEVLLCGKALFEGLAGYYLKKYVGIPYVIFTYAMELEVWSSKKSELRKLKRVLSAADCIVYINEVTKKLLLRLGATEKQLVKIQPGVDKRYFNEVSEPLIESTLRHYGIKRPYIISVGRLIPRKGFDVLIEAFSNLDQTKFGDYQLVIVGSGPEEAQLAALAENHGMAGSIKILSEVPDKHLPPLYHGAELFALTPRELQGDIEGFGMVYLEAAACGLSALATKTGGAGEAVQHEQTGLVVELAQPTLLKEGLGKLLTESALRSSLGAAAQRRARADFTWPDKITQLEELVTGL